MYASLYVCVCVCMPLCVCVYVPACLYQSVCPYVRLPTLQCCEHKIQQIYILGIPRGGPLTTSGFGALLSIWALGDVGGGMSQKGIGGCRAPCQKGFGDLLALPKKGLVFVDPFSQKGLAVCLCAPFEHCFVLICGDNQNRCALCGGPLNIWTNVYYLVIATLRLMLDDCHMSVCVDVPQPLSDNVCLHICVYVCTRRGCTLRGQHANAKVECKGKM